MKKHFIIDMTFETACSYVVDAETREEAETIANTFARNNTKWIFDNRNDDLKFAAELIGTLPDGEVEDDLLSRYTPLPEEAYHTRKYSLARFTSTGTEIDSKKYDTFEEALNDFYDGVQYIRDLVLVDIDNDRETARMIKSDGERRTIYPIKNILGLN